MARPGRRRPFPKAASSSLDPASRIVQFDALLTTTIFLVSGVAASDYGTYLGSAFAHIFDPSSTTADLAVLSILKFVVFTVTAAVPTQIVSIAFVAAVSLKIVALVLFSKPEEIDLPPFLVWAIVIVAATFAVLEAFMAVRNFEGWIVQLSTTAVPKTDLESGAETETAEDAEKKEKEKGELEALKQPIPWKRLGTMLYPEWWIIFSGLVSLLITTLFNLAIPSFFGRVIDLVSSGVGDKEALSMLIIQMVALVLFGAVVSAARSLAFTLTGYRIVRRLRSELFYAIVRA
ncbi:hypothetical protein BJ742DRAFT_766150 [Cladochytrium replicatum]|nr:hypothetical protein BJ742DRAFT_766150 [Cladochytrium replicatum]